MGADFFVTFFFLKCYIVERGKNAGGKSGQKDSCRCRISERGKTDVDNELFMKLYGAYQKELYLYLYSLCRNRHQAEDLLHGDSSKKPADPCAGRCIEKGTYLFCCTGLIAYRTKQYKKKYQYDKSQQNCKKHQYEFYQYPQNM